MKNILRSLVTIGVLALPGTAILAEDDDDEDGRRGRWRHRIEPGFWYIPRYDPGYLDDGYGPGPRYGYGERFGYRQWHPYSPPTAYYPPPYYPPPPAYYPPPTWHSPWDYSEPRYGYWHRHPHARYHFRDGRRWHRGDDDDDDDD